MIDPYLTDNYAQSKHEYPISVIDFSMVAHI